MKVICSKNVISLYPGGQLLQDDFFRQVREKAFNTDRYTTKEQVGTNKDKKNVTSPTGFGPNDRQHNPGAGMGLDREDSLSKPKGVGSGYNDGGAADDEIGPGNTSIVPDPYYGQNVLNELFLDLNLKNQDSQKIKTNVQNVLHSDPVVVPHRRYNVDRLN